MTQIDELHYPMKSMTLVRGGTGSGEGFWYPENLVRTAVSTGKVYRKERFLQEHGEHGEAMLGSPSFIPDRVWQMAKEHLQELQACYGTEEKHPHKA